MDGVILAIESSGDGGGAAILRGGKVLSEAHVSGPRRHGAELMPCIDRAVADAGLAQSDLAVIAVDQGPGSYTGLRIGIAAAQAIGFALNIPVIGVNALEAMALQYAMQAEVRDELELWPVLDARRDEVMTARMLYANQQLRRGSGDQLVTPQTLADQAKRLAIVFGSGVAPYHDRFHREHLTVDDKEFVLQPSSIALQAWHQLAEASMAADIERRPVEPIYFRRVLAKTVEERHGQA